MSEIVRIYYNDTPSSVVKMDGLLLKKTELFVTIKDRLTRKAIDIPLVKVVRIENGGGFCD